MSSESARSSGVPSVRIELTDGRRIQGFVDEGYGPVVDTFRANFLERRDLGAACSIYVAGRRVVDLWGGLADRIPISKGRSNISHSPDHRFWKKTSTSKFLQGKRP